MRERVVSALLLAALAAAPMIAHAGGETFYVNLASRVAILAMAAAGLNLALGYGGLVSLGHAAFFGLGGYAAGIAAHHAFEGTRVFGLLPATTSMPVTWVAAAAVAALIAVPIGLISLRTRGVYFIMITLAFAQMVFYFAISFPAYGGEDGLPIYLRAGFPGLDANAPLTFFWISFACLVLTLLATRTIMAARFGAALTMAHLNETRLAAVGIGPLPVRLAAFVLSAVIVGWSGALFAELNGFVSPSMLSWQRSGELIVIVILGGTARLAGPVAGAIAFVLLETFIGAFTERWQLVLGLVLLGVVLFARGGLMGALAGPPRHG